ncbi:hypothetical protein RM550_34070 [Streptomyces sp. DSM 41527]|uniref:Uncharacterized protein n=1 Tax=Streptomyces mooreae TaxID=3075523 RepID=A0ABU2TIE7_9ACTN|nr:hypothetical protein [Streptomyces sp. DSM 41527]MDT0460695.1 hypothetical protein [Streptomyces sp. DSM 41527]
MTATTPPPHTPYQDIHTAIPLTPTHCHPTAHSQPTTTWSSAGPAPASTCTSPASPLQAKNEDLYELAQTVRTQEADLRTVAQRLESWRTT